MKYYWKAESEKKYRNRYTGNWRTVVPSNGYKVNRNDYKNIISDAEGIDVTEEFFKNHVRAYQCVVTYWCKVDEDGYTKYINPNNKNT